MPTQNILASSHCRVLHSSENINIYLWLKKNCATPRNQNNEELWLSFMKSNINRFLFWHWARDCHLHKAEEHSELTAGSERMRAVQSTLTDLQRHTMTRLFPFAHTSLSLSLSQLFRFNYLTINLTGIKWGSEETLETSKTLRAFLMIHPWN